MKLSIIIPTYNSSAVIGRALKSIRDQKFTDYEVLIMDGASTDDTVKIADSFNDPRIHVYSEPDKGIYDAMNKGIKKAQGEWLYFLGSDDWLYDNNTLLNIFCNSNISKYEIVYGNVESDHLQLGHRGAWTIDKIEYNRCHQAIFYKKRFLIKVGGYNLKYPILADYDLNLKWFLDSKHSHLYVDSLIAHFSEGGASGQIRDENFLRDKTHLFLARGWRKLTTEQKRYYVRELMRNDRIGAMLVNLYGSAKHALQHYRV